MLSVAYDAIALRGQFLIRAVSRKYSKIWFRFTSEIKVEKENYHNEITIFVLKICQNL